MTGECTTSTETRETALLLNDVVDNIRDAGGFGGWLPHMAGCAGTDDRFLQL